MTEDYSTRPTTPLQTILAKAHLESCKTVSDRLLFVLHKEQGESGDYQRISRKSKISAKAFQEAADRRSPISSQMVQAICQARPYYAFWCVTGKSPLDGMKDEIPSQADLTQCNLLMARFHFVLADEMQRAGNYERFAVRSALLKSSWPRSDSIRDPSLGMIEAVCATLPRYAYWLAVGTLPLSSINHEVPTS